MDALRRGDSPLTLGELVAAWDFAQEIASGRVVDRSPQRLCTAGGQLPDAGVTGPTGRATRQLRPRAGAVRRDPLPRRRSGGRRLGGRLHLDGPDDLPSGVYAARLRRASDEDHVPFFVRPPRGTATAPIAFLVPTFTYLAYANEHIAGATAELVPVRTIRRSTSAEDQLHRRRHGLHSLYDHHPRRHRRLLLLPAAPARQPAAEVRTVRILGAPEQLRRRSLPDRLAGGRRGIAYDVVTDEDLHAEGAALLAPYQVVLTGSHPEYWTAPMLDALEAYLAGGGRLMYLGGNGFYWVTGVDPERPHVIEVRRGQRHRDLGSRSPARLTSARPASRAVSGATAAARRRSSSASASPRRARLRAALPPPAGQPRPARRLHLRGRRRRRADRRLPAS